MCFDGEKVSEDQFWRSKAMMEEKQEACLVSAQQAGVAGELRENKAGSVAWTILWTILE